MVNAFVFILHFVSLSIGVTNVSPREKPRGPETEMEVGESEVVESDHHFVVPHPSRARRGHYCHSKTSS